MMGGQGGYQGPALGAQCPLQGSLVVGFRDQSHSCVMNEGEAHGTGEEVPAPTNSRRHTAALGISTLFGTFPEMNAAPQTEGLFHAAAFKCCPGIRKVGGKSGRGPREGVYLFSPAVLLVPANNPHGSFCLARKTC